MFVLLQVYPLEVADLYDEGCCLDVIAVDASKAQLEQFLEAYERRYQTAVAKFDAWDDMSKDWGEEHGRMSEELRHRYQVYGPLIRETRFKIVEARSGRDRMKSTAQRRRRQSKSNEPGQYPRGGGDGGRLGA